MDTIETVWSHSLGNNVSVSGCSRNPTHFAAGGGENKARLDEKIDDEVGHDARGNTSSREQEDDTQHYAKKSCRSGRAQGNAKAFPHQAPDPVNCTEENARPEHLDDHSVTLHHEPIHRPAPEHDLFQNTRDDGESDCEYLKQARPK